MKLTPWSRFLKLLALERRDILQIFYYAVFSGMVALSLPLGIQAIVNLIQGAQISTSWVVLVSLVTIGTIFTGVLQFMQLRIIETIQQRIFVRSSFELSYRFPKIKMEELRNYYPPELANRFFDTLTIQKGLSKVLIDVPSALLQILFALILLSFYHAFFIIFGIILLGTLFFVLLYTARKGMQTSLEESKYKYRVARWIQEVARSITSFKLSGNTNLALDTNDRLVQKYLAQRERHFNILKIQFLQLVGFKAIITAVLLIIGGALVLNQEMNIGQFVAAEIIILLVINSIEKLIMGLENLYDMLTAIEKLGEVVDKQMESQEGEILNFDKAGMTIELDQISYATPNRPRPILKDISFTISPESRILIQGESGSGKSSLLRILSGIISPTSGNMYVNNLSISAIHLNNYRGNLGLSLSEELPFEDSLRDNLTFGNKAISDERIFEVMEAIKMTHFLKELPQGLDTMMYPEGKQMSFTIAKKILLVRSILKQPKVLILEEALDQFNESERRDIIDYLCDPSQPWALVVVSNSDYWKTYCNEIISLKA